jgi:hypothetical protein
MDHVHYQPNVTNVPSGAVAFDAPILGVSVQRTAKSSASIPNVDERLRPVLLPC